MLSRRNAVGDDTAISLGDSGDFQLVSDGTDLFVKNSGGTTLLTIDSGGNLSTTGDLSASGTVGSLLIPLPIEAACVDVGVTVDTTILWGSRCVLRTASMPDGSSTKLYWAVQLPYDYDGRTIYLDAWFYGDATGDVRIGGGFTPLPVGTLLTAADVDYADSVSGYYPTAVQTISAVNTAMRVRITLDTAVAHAGNLISVQLIRLGADALDTLTSTMKFFAASLRY